MANGVIAVIGFVTPAEASQLAHDRQVEPVNVMVHPDAEGDATAIVSLPYDRVVHHRQYSVLNASAIALQVAPPSRLGV